MSLIRNNGEVTTAPTYTETGIKTRTCTECGATKTEILSILPMPEDPHSHYYGAWVMYDETQHIRYCDCGDMEFSAHQWNDGVVTTPATYTEKGIKTYICVDCGAEKTEELPMLPIETWENPFTDVKEDEPYYDAVAFVTEKGLFKGTSETEFSPEMSMTRSMFVTVLGRLAGIDTAEYEGSAFTDVEEKIWYAPFVAWAVENKIVLGYDDGTFGADDEITVEQAAVILARYAKFVKVYEAGDAALDAYQDAENISAWAEEDVLWALESNVYTAVDGEIRPQALTQRSLIAVMLYNFTNQLLA